MTNSHVDKLDTKPASDLAEENNTGAGFARRLKAARSKVKKSASKGCQGCEGCNVCSSGCQT